QYSLSPDPLLWGSALSRGNPEPDDALHEPEYTNGKLLDDHGLVLSLRGLANVGCLVILSLGIIALFLGYPVVNYVRKTLITSDSTNISVNATGQIPVIGNFALIDLDTPKDAYTIISQYSGKEMKLVFSDEFETPGRTFYPGDDPFWEAADLHYWQVAEVSLLATNNMEWYDPASITTKDGSLQITLSATPVHGLNYSGGLLSSWNKFCFTSGLLVSSASLPGSPEIHGLWPAFWAMGNLGRAGYGATLDGAFWYTYDSCDVGTLANQTLNDLPEISLTSGDNNAPYNGELSYLPGQRLSRCTCKGESHPGPVHSDGTYVGRAAPEIDVFEAQISDLPDDQGSVGAVSQSGQWAPFNAAYVWANTSDNLIIPNTTNSELNTYIGGALQQATSVVSVTNQSCYELTQGGFTTYGFEYKPGFDDSYISWLNNGQVAWTLMGAGLGADTQTEIGARPVPQEPMYIMANLGMSTNFGFVDLKHLTFPTTFKLDYIRVYQYPDQINIGCDPPDFPTQDYINTYIEAYTNPNLTTWSEYGQSVPKNSLLGEC
ncbi:glycoside hydrolase family 16 protein, partial [Roridomyces roridus]